MDSSFFASILKPGAKVNVVVRFLAIPLSFLILIVFADSVHDLILESLTLDETIKTFFNIIIMTILFWPFSYVAIKGKNPEHWHPY
tara:strand:- start:6581 stop:6838 length:258 start_codon:yes stop_codon:yes gene_type:complete